MAACRLKHNRSVPQTLKNHGGGHTPFPIAVVIPLATLPAPLEHGALGVWDEVAVGALLVGCAIAYAVWFYLSGRNEKPHDSD